MAENKLSVSVRSLILLACFLLGLTNCGDPNAGARNKVQTSADVGADDFTVVVLPDSQCYTSNGGGLLPSACGKGGLDAMFTAQMNWIVNARALANIKAVLGVGDIVNCGHVDAEWTNADAAYKLLHAAGIPYAPVLGNHDYDGACTTGISSRFDSKYNATFGPTRFAGEPWYGASSYPAGSNDNFYIQFDTSTAKMLVLALELYPRSGAVAWAQSVLDANPDRQVIVTTHGYLMADGHRILDTDPQGPNSYTFADWTNGENLWSNFIARNKKIVAVVSGHVGGSNGAGAVAHRADIGVSGNVVAQMVANYQFDAGGGNGFLRILKFKPSSGVIEVSTFSPFAGVSHADPGNQFTVPYRAD